jgi:TPR repeat protein
MFAKPTPNDGNILKAIELYKESIKLGNPKALMAMGRIYEEGIGVKPDFELAV